MEPRLNGVLDLSYNGTMVRGSPFVPRAFCNYYVSVVICVFAVFRF